MGAGSWGTTFAQVLCDAGTSTVLYARRPSQAKAIGELHENPDYLPGVTLVPSLDATADAAAALDGADMVAFAVPAQSLRAATADIMADITDLLATIRHETPPAEVWDPAVGARVPYLDRTGSGAPAPAGAEEPGPA